MSSNGAASKAEKPFERLPTNVVPIHYDITIRPDLVKCTFSGEEAVDIQVKQETDRLVLNALQLDVTIANFTFSTGEILSSEAIETNDGEELLTVVFPSSLKPGKGRLYLVFNGKLDDKMKGLYRSKYQSGDEERFAATTHFEPTGARSAFPCWDEPLLKATFDMTLVVPKDRVALSNMHVIDETDSPFNDNLRTVKYATSPIMSTYLVAIVVGEFDHVEGTTDDGVEVRVYTPVGKKEQGTYALDVAIKSLNYYNEYFGIKYHLSKCDLIAIPDFPIGAMENWGLVTYRNTRLLVDSLNTANDVKQEVAIVVAHELAHMWFGNYVSPAWWTHLWLKEGYASFMEFLCVDVLFPEYDIWMQYMTMTFLLALNIDGLHNSHPIEVEVGHPSQIAEIFDDISYNKGASVIRMLFNYLGSSDFRKGMSLYLNRHKFKNTVTEDLWTALEEASNKPVGEVMSTWTKQKGYPVITVSQKQDGNNRILTVSQEKFCSDGKLPDNEKNAIWMVPLTISTASSPGKVVVETLLTTKSSEIVVPNVPAGDWVKLNSGTVGFYRVEYSSEMLAELLPAIVNKTLAPVDRLGLQNDQFALCQAGRLSTAAFLKLLGAFVNEDDLAVWSSINAALGKLNALLSYTDSKEQFQNFGRRLLTNIYAKLGWEAIRGETYTNALLRPLVIGRLVSLRDGEVLAEAGRRFEGHANGTAIIPADLRMPIYRAAISSDEKNFDQLLKLYRESDLSEERNRIACALGAVGGETKLNEVLKFALSSEVRAQDSAMVIQSVAGSKVGRALAWRFFQENKATFKERYGGAAFTLPRLLNGMLSNFATEDQVQDVSSFFSKNVFPGAERSVQQVLESIRNNVDWLARDSGDIRNYLNSFE